MNIARSDFTAGFFFCWGDLLVAFFNTELYIVLTGFSFYNRHIFHPQNSIIFITGIFVWGDGVVIYADILMLVNLIVDYFLLLLCGVILQRKPPFWRTFLGAAAGAISSLYIFFPKSNTFVEIAINLLISSIIVLITFGYHTTKKYLRAVLCFFAITFLYAGAMLCVWNLFKPHGLIIHNSVVYYDISAVFLILFSVIGYFISATIGFFLRKRGKTATRCQVRLTLRNNFVTVEGIIDSGNSLVDTFGMCEVIIADNKVVQSLFGYTLDNDFCRSRYRALPCSTVSDATILDGYRIDDAEIICNSKAVKVKKPILAISKTNLTDCGAIINPKTIEGV